MLPLKERAEQLADLACKDRTSVLWAIMFREAYAHLIELREECAEAVGAQIMQVHRAVECLDPDRERPDLWSAAGNVRYYLAVAAEGIRNVGEEPERSAP